LEAKCQFQSSTYVLSRMLLVVRTSSSWCLYAGYRLISFGVLHLPNLSISVGKVLDGKKSFHRRVLQTAENRTWS